MASISKYENVFKVINIL